MAIDNPFRRNSGSYRKEPRKSESIDSSHSPFLISCLLLWLCKSICRFFLVVFFITKGTPVPGRDAWLTRRHLSFVVYLPVRVN